MGYVIEHTVVVTRSDKVAANLWVTRFHGTEWAINRRLACGTRSAGETICSVSYLITRSPAPRWTDWIWVSTCER
jgi:hypothetical protein